MKKVKFEKKLNLKKQTVAKLSKGELTVLQGGFLVISSHGQQTCCMATDC